MVSPVVVCFDVNETLLDLGALDPLFEEHFGSVALRPTWFTAMLQVAFVGGLTGRYVDFTSAQTAALHMTAARAGRSVTDANARVIVEAMRRLPPHPDARPGLQLLREAGFTIAALTNSVLDVAQDQLAFAGLADLFDGVYSADAVAALKPQPKAYHMVADAWHIDISQMWLIAAHGWDVSGALAAGARAGFVARGGATPIPLGSQPEVVGQDIEEVALQLIAVGRPTP